MFSSHAFQQRLFDRNADNGVWLSLGLFENV